MNSSNHLWNITIYKCVLPHTSFFIKPQKKPLSNFSKAITFTCIYIDLNMSVVRKHIRIIWIYLIGIAAATGLFISLYVNLYDGDINVKKTLSYTNLFNLVLKENEWMTFELIPETSFWVYNYTFSAVCGLDINNNTAIFIMGCTENISIPIDCHIMYDGEADFDTVPAIMEAGMYYKKRCLATYCWCPIQRNMTPIYVELQAKHTVNKAERKRIYIDNKISCDKRIQNTLRMSNKPKIGLCMEYNYNITSARTLAEYVELHRLLGVDKAMMHGFDYVSEEVLRLIKYYQKKGFLELLPWRINDPKIMQNRFFKADCLARFRGQVDYAVFDDVDEFIIPSSDSLPETLQGLIKYIQSHHLQNEDICFLSFYWTSFCIDEYVHHRNLPTLITGAFNKRYQPTSTIKSIMNVDLTYSINDHFATRCRSGYKINVSPDTAKVHHYRANPKRDLGFLYLNGSCETVDNAAKRYQTRLLDRVNFVITEAQDSNNYQ